MLNKGIIFFILFFFLAWTSFISADELNNPIEPKKKYNLSICAIFKNEAKYLKEWLEYHRDFGIDHFYLYNIGSRDFYQLILRPYIKEGIVTLVNWPEAINFQNNNDASTWALSTQIPAYENAVNFIARDETKWLVFVDVDEFLVSSNENIRDLLKKYDDYTGISFSSSSFDAGFLNTLTKTKLLIPFLEVPPSPQILDKSVAKMIFKPDQCIGFIWPPYQCRFKPMQVSTEVAQQELRINRYINRNTGILSSGKKAKSKNMADYHVLSEEEITVLSEEGYVELERPIYPHVPEFMKKIMELERIW